MCSADNEFCDGAIRSPTEIKNSYSKLSTFSNSQYNKLSSFESMSSLNYCLDLVPRARRGLECNELKVDCGVLNIG